jgi:hypothetical protein
MLYLSPCSFSRVPQRLKTKQRDHSPQAQRRSPTPVAHVALLLWVRGRGCVRWRSSLHEDVDKQRSLSVADEPMSGLPQLRPSRRTAPRHHGGPCSRTPPCRCWPRRMYSLALPVTMGVPAAARHRSDNLAKRRRLGGQRYRGRAAARLAPNPAPSSARVPLARLVAGLSADGRAASRHRRVARRRDPEARPPPGGGASIPCRPPPPIPTAAPRRSRDPRRLQRMRSSLAPSLQAHSSARGPPSGPPLAQRRREASSLRHWRRRQR